MADKEKRKKRGLTRREEKETVKTVEVPGPKVEVQKFKCPLDGQEFGTFDVLRAHFAAAHPAAFPPEVTKLMVNGKQYEVQIEPHWTLQRTLQFKLGLTGSAKTMCDRGACGSCTVIIDGRPVLSCMTLAVECEGKSIETIEGIAAAKHPLIYSYMKWDCMQCGYCTPGFLVTSKALLDRNPNPTEDEVKQALSGNICRCGTYQRHLMAVLETAKQLQAAKQL